MTDSRKRKRIGRSKYDMLIALARHVRLLESYTELAMTNDDYLGEIAGKVRLLVVKTKQNKPLLLTVAEAFGAPVPQGQAATPETPAMTWPEVLQLPALHVEYGGGRPSMTMSFQDLIRAWAEQTGAPHEDWSMDEGLHVMFSPHPQISGAQLSRQTMIAIGRSVVRSAKTFMEGFPLPEQKPKKFEL